MVGEVMQAASRLYAAGLPRNAVQAAAVIAESCRDDSRTGAVTHKAIASWLDASERTARRAVTELVEAGVVVVARRGGGRAKATTLYYLPPLASWEAGTPAIQVAGVEQGIQSPLVAPVAPNSGHPGGRSNGQDDEGSPAIQVAGDPRHAEPNSGQHADELRPPMDVRYPVVPGKDLLGTTDVTTDRASVPDTASPPKINSSINTTIPAGSRCGLPSCRAPRPCGACAEAKRVRPAAARRAAELRLAAAAACVLGCDTDGYLGPHLCDHDPDHFARGRRGRALVDAVLRRPADIERQRQDELAELDAVQAPVDDDSERAPRHHDPAAAQPLVPSDQREDVA